MEGNRRATFTLGSLLLLIGGWFLAVQFLPQLADFVEVNFGWPWFIIGAGIVFFVSALLSGVSGLAVPGFILMGIGGILYYQNEYNDWESWSYMWGLIISSVGLGVFMMNILEGKFRRAIRDGGNTFMTGLIFFLIFGSFFRPLFDQEPLFGEYWPLGLIVIGLWLLVRALLPGKRKKKVTIIAEDTISPDELDNIVTDTMDKVGDAIDGAMDSVEASIDAAFGDDDEDDEDEEEAAA